VDGVIYCRVQRDAVTNVQGRTFDLRNGKYHLLVASGSSLKENSVGYHDIGRLPSAQPINLAEVQDLSGSSRLLIQLHGAFMIGVPMANKCHMPRLQHAACNRPHIKFSLKHNLNFVVVFGQCQWVVG